CHQPQEPIARSRQARHHGADGNAEYLRRLDIRKLLHRDEQQYRALLLWQLRERRQQLAVTQPVLLARRAAELPLVRILDRNLRRAVRHALQPRQGKVMQDGEGPGARIATWPSLVPAANGPLQAIL